jgi:hypothetical protein
VVGSQIANLIPDLSFAHNSCYTFGSVSVIFTLPKVGLQHPDLQSSSYNFKLVRALMEETMNAPLKTFLKVSCSTTFGLKDATTSH